MTLEFDFSEQPKECKPFFEKPTNSTALALYLLLEAGLRGIDNYEAVVKGRNWKFNTRISELINKHGLAIYKKDEEGVNQFGHKFTSKRYFLYENEYKKNLELYNKLNK